jgi:hypothetical protein
MPINPFSSPLKTEYKPLGLDKFFTPLSQMQSKYDVAKSEIEDTKFKLARMSQDDPKAAAILEDLNQKTKELSQNLVRTGNYREAAKKLNTLNRTYAEDKEIQAYKSSYDNYTNWLASEEERVAEGEISQEQLDLAKYKIQETWEGTDYDEQSDKYNILNPTPATANLEEDIRKESLDLAKMLVENKHDEFEQVIDQYGDAQMLKTTVANLPLDRAQREIRNFLANSDKYKNYIEELARARHFKAHNESKKLYQNGLVENVEADRVIQNSLNTIQKGIIAATEANETTSLQQLQKLQGDIEKVLESGDPIAYEQLAENLAVQQAMGRFDDIARDAADLVDNLAVSQAYKTSSDSKGKAKKEAFDKIGALSMNAATINPNATLVKGQSPTAFIEEENRLAETGSPYEEAQKLKDARKETDYNLATRTSNATIMGTKQQAYFDAQDEIQGLTNFVNSYDNKLNALKEERANIVNEQSQATLPEEKRMYMNQLASLDEKVRELNASKTVQLEPLYDLLNEGDLSISNQSKEIQDLWKASGKDPIVFLNKMEELQQTAAGVKDLTQEDYDKMIADFNASYDPDVDPYLRAQEEAFSGVLYGSELNPWPGTFEENPEMVATYLARERNMSKIDPSSACGPLDEQCQKYQQQLNINANLVQGFIDRYGISPSQAQTQLDEKNYTFTGTPQYGIDLMKAYNQSITVNGDAYVLPLEINIDERFDLMTDEAGKRVSENFEKQRGKEKIPATVYNPATGETVPVTNNGSSVYIEYNPAYYEWDKGSYVGNNSEGIPIFKYPIKPVNATSQAGASTIESLFKSMQRKAIDPEKVTQINLNDAEIANFKRNNPDNLYLPAAGANMGDQMLKGFRDYYLSGIDLAKGQLTQNGSEDIIEQTLSNYAPLWLIGDANRRGIYVTAAENLQKKQQQAIVSDNTMQGTAIWNRIDDNNYYGYEVRYHTTADQEIIKKVTKVFAVKNSNGELVVDPDKNQSFPSERVTTNQLALSMAEDALMYGVGRDEDIPLDRNNSPIVIAFRLFDK